MANFSSNRNGTSPTLTNLDESMNDATPGGSKGTTLDTNAPTKGWICHLVAKTNATQKDLFDMQASTRNVLKLLKHKDPTLTILNKNDDQVSSDEEIGTTSEEFAAFATYKTFKINNGRTQHLVYFTVRLSRPFHLVKDLDCIDELDKLKVYLEKKAFRSTEYVILGWFARIHPLITWKDELLSDLTSVITELTGKQAPIFDIIKRPKKFGNQKRIETQVFEIEVDKQDEEALTNILIDQKFFEVTGAMLVPAKITRNAGPVVYSKLLTAHTLYCNNIETIPIFGLKPTLLQLKEPENGTCPILDTIVDFIDGTKIHRTARSEEIGKFIISFPKGNRDKAMSRIKSAIDLIIEMEFEQNQPEYLFDNRPPRIGQPPRKFANSKLDSYASSLCASFGIDETTETETTEPVFITLNSKRRYQGSQSPSYRLMVTNDTPSQQSTLTQITESTKVDSVQTEMESLRKTVEDFITEQRRVNVETTAKIDTRMSNLEQTCITHLSKCFTEWRDAEVEAHVEPDKRRRKERSDNSTIPASPSGSSTMSADDTPMAEASK